MNVYEEILFVQQIHYVVILQDHILYVNFNLLQKTKNLFLLLSVIVFLVIKCSMNELFVKVNKNLI
jgi:hypothetical protein